MPQTPSENFGFVKDGKVFLRAHGLFAERAIGEVRDSEQEVLGYYVSRYEALKTKIIALKNEISAAANKGSFLQHILHLKSKLLSYDGIGDYEALQKMLGEQEAELNELISQNKIKNKASKEAMIAEAESIKDSLDWKVTTDKFKELKLLWLKTGGTDKAVELELEQRFNAAVSHFFERRKEYLDDQKDLIILRIEKYERLLAEAKELLQLVNPSIAKERFKQLQGQWKEVGLIPKIKGRELYQELKDIGELLFQSRKAPIYRKTLQDEHEVERIALCLSAENIEINASASDQIKAIRERWAVLGRALNKQYGALNHRFNLAITLASEKVFIEQLTAKKTAGYDTLSDDQKAALRKNLLRELIARDKKELLSFEENHEKHTGDPRNADFLKLIENKIRILKNRIDIKEKILQKI